MGGWMWHYVEPKKAEAAKTNDHQSPFTFMNLSHTVQV